MVSLGRIIRKSLFPLTSGLKQGSTLTNRKYFSKDRIGSVPSNYIDLVDE
jgi:hypothetical protein